MIFAECSVGRPNAAQPSQFRDIFRDTLGYKDQTATQKQTYLLTYLLTV